MPRTPKLKQPHKTTRRSKVDNKAKERKQSPGVRGNNQGANQRHPSKLAKPGNETHTNEINPTKKGQCNQAAENDGKESETRDVKHRAKVKQLPHFPPRARRLRREEQLVLQQPGCLLVQGPGEEANRFGHNGKERAG